MTLIARMGIAFAGGAVLWCVFVIAAAADMAVDKVQRLRRVGSIQI